MDAERGTRAEGSAGSTTHADRGAGAGDADGAALARSFLGRRLGEYALVREIGRGSMGIVFEAEQERLARKVAVKVLPPSLSVTETVIRRFLREAQSVARLDHEHIVRIHDVGESDGVHYYAMQFIEGRALDRVLAERKLDPKESARIGAQCSRALFYAHENGIIHRDVKPANILITYKDKPVLTDFGLARPEKAATLTESGALVGTPIYMSPEQVRGERGAIDRRTDIYALGVTLYEMLCGCTPFSGASTQEILNKIEAEEPKPLRRLNPSVPKPLAVIVHKAMEKEPGRRYQTAIELALDLERFLANEPIQARPAGLRTRVLRVARRHKLITTLCVLLLAVSALAWIAGAAGRKNREELERVRFSTLLGEGRFAYQQQRYGAAVETFGAALALEPESVDARVERGRALFRLKRYDEAVADFETALAQDAANARALLWRGIVRFQDGTAEERGQGLVDIKASLDANPDDPEALLEKARICLDIARDTPPPHRDTFLSEAREITTRLLRADPNDDDALVVQGMCYEEEGTFRRDQNLIDLAFANYERARELDRSNDQALVLKTRDRESLLKELRETERDADPQLPRSSLWVVLASEGLSAWNRNEELRGEVVDRALGILFPAREDVAATLEPAPAAVERRFAEAEELWTEDRLVEAARRYEEILREAPLHLDARNRLVEFYLLQDHRDLAAARRHVERSLEAAPSDLRTLLLAFAVYRDQRDSARMRDVVQMATEHHPAILNVPHVARFLHEQDLAPKPETRERAGDGGREAEPDSPPE